MAAVTNNPPKLSISPNGAFKKPAPLVIVDLESPKHTDIQNLNDNIGKWTKHSEKHKSKMKHIYHHPYSGRTTPPLREAVKDLFFNPDNPKEKVITEEGFGQGLPEFTFEALELANLVPDES
ncbi:MAG TPA: hypothetical protein VLG44_08365 [Chlamydiales bacterium]|nr:hypothetical protein [Chlamydiales bacterium]